MRLESFLHNTRRENVVSVTKVAMGGTMPKRPVEFYDGYLPDQTPHVLIHAYSTNAV
jgi:hypothetical protein